MPDRTSADRRVRRQERANIGSWQWKFQLLTPCAPQRLVAHRQAPSIAPGSPEGANAPNMEFSVQQPAGKPVTKRPRTVVPPSTSPEGRMVL